MKIDASRYMLFWSNPERYRLRELWKIAPIEPSADSFAALLTYGRRRGTCFHEIRDGLHGGRSLDAIVAELKDGGFGEREIEAAKRLSAAVSAKYPNESYLAHERCFEYQIPNSPHIMTGRIDHLLEWPEAFCLPDGSDFNPLIVGDWKTSKARTKADMASRLDQYRNSVQVDFYLLGAATLGFPCFNFLYRVVEDRGKDKPAVVHEAWTDRSTLRLKKFAQGVHQTCELIEFMKRTFGVEKPWPFVPEKFKTGYEHVEGFLMYDGFMPDGFEPKVEHLETMMDDEPEDADAM